MNIFKKTKSIKDYIEMKPINGPITVREASKVIKNIKPGKDKITELWE